MVTARRDRVGVIGGGLGGLAAAATLAARGHDVVLFEARSALGGKAAVLEEEGFRFDMGPTILTLPEVLERIFAEAGLPLAERLDLVRLDPQWRSFFADGSTLDLEAEPARMAARIDAFAPGKGAGPGYERFLSLAKGLDDISRRWIFWKSVGGISDLATPRAIVTTSLLKDVLGMRLGRTVGGTLRSMVPDARVAQMLDHYVQYVGSAPDASPAVLCGIAHMQSERGVWYPMGGTAAVPRALATLARDLGVEVRTGVAVARILLDEAGGVRGVLLDTGEEVALRALVSNMDSVRTHEELLPLRARRPFARRRRYEPACSGVVLYLGLKERYDHLLHHGFVFSKDPHEEFDAIYRRGEPAPDPTCYLCAPARTEPGVAPPGGEALYVLVHTPFLRDHHDWREMFPRYRRVILDKLARHGGMPDLEERIVFERALTPVDIRDRYRTLKGAIYGLSSHGRFTGAFKPANRSPDVPRLYLAGGAAHPGPGMPMVMMSGWIAADALDRDGVAEPRVTPSWREERRALALTP